MSISTPNCTVVFDVTLVLKLKSSLGVITFTVLTPYPIEIELVPVMSFLLATTSPVAELNISNV